jgi:hypothetical protein
LDSQEQDLPSPLPNEARLQDSTSNILLDQTRHDLSPSTIILGYNLFFEIVTSRTEAPERQIIIITHYSQACLHQNLFRLHDRIVRRGLLFFEKVTRIPVAVWFMKPMALDSSRISADTILHTQMALMLKRSLKVEPRVLLE